MQFDQTSQQDEPQQWPMNKYGRVDLSDHSAAVLGDVHLHYHSIPQPPQTPAQGGSDSPESLE